MVRPPPPRARRLERAWLSGIAAKVRRIGGICASDPSLRSLFKLGGELDLHRPFTRRGRVAASPSSPGCSGGSPGARVVSSAGAHRPSHTPEEDGALKESTLAMCRGRSHLQVVEATRQFASSARHVGAGSKRTANRPPIARRAPSELALGDELAMFVGKRLEHDAPRAGVALRTSDPARQGSGQERLARGRPAHSITGHGHCP